MKRKFVTLAALLLSAALCIMLSGCISIILDGGERVKGNGQVTTKEISLSGALSGARTTTSIDIVLDPDLKDKAVLEGESNILDMVEVQTSRGVLTVGFKPHISIFSSRQVTLRIPVISSGRLETNSSGSISMKGSAVMKGDSFELRTSSSGSIKVAIEAKQLKAVSSSSGSINAAGSAAAGNIELSSSGRFHGFDLKLETADVRLSSSGDAEVYVSGELNGSTSSSGSIIYDGNPSKVNVSSSSSGKAVKR